MKIGILTYHRSHNYGALLQAIALRKVLADMGHQVTYIDYWPAYHRQMYAAFSIRWMMSRGGMRKQCAYLKTCMTNYSVRKKRIKALNSFISKFIIPYTSSLEEKYDLVIHGSDQIWRKQPEINTYNPVYFGKNNIRAEKHVSYAASMGILPNCNADKNKLKELLSNLDCISVREQDLLELVKDLGYQATHIDLDPTLLLTSTDWVEMFELKKRKQDQKYALYYKIKDSFDINALQQFVRSKGLTLKVINSKALGQETDEQIMTADPVQFLNLLYNADFVFTSSFHGLAFSLLFHKPFMASFTNNAGRAASLLNALDLSDHLIQPQLVIPAHISEIDYDLVDSKLHNMRLSSIKYLSF